jgi:hypothetical protein
LNTRNLQKVENDTGGENITLSIVVDILVAWGIDHLWSDKSWGTASLEQVLLDVIFSSKTEIDQFELVLLQSDV